MNLFFCCISFLFEFDFQAAPLSNSAPRIRQKLEIQMVFGQVSIRVYPTGLFLKPLNSRLMITLTRYSYKYIWMYGCKVLNNLAFSIPTHLHSDTHTTIYVSYHFCYKRVQLYSISNIVSPSIHSLPSITHKYYETKTGSRAEKYVPSPIKAS